MKTLLTLTLLFICSLAFGQKKEPKTDTLKIQLSEEVLKLLEDLNKEGEELQKDSQFILINAKIVAVQQKQIALVTGFQQGKEAKGQIVGIKDGKLLIIKQ
jgi:hypothetical protein